MSSRTPTKSPKGKPNVKAPAAAAPGKIMTRRATLAQRSSSQESSSDKSESSKGQLTAYTTKDKPPSGATSSTVPKLQSGEKKRRRQNRKTSTNKEEDDNINYIRIQSTMYEMACDIYLGIDDSATPITVTVNEIFAYFMACIYGFILLYEHGLDEGDTTHQYDEFSMFSENIRFIEFLQGMKVPELIRDMIKNYLSNYRDIEECPLATDVFEFEYTNHRSNFIPITLILDSHTHNMDMPYYFNLSQHLKSFYEKKMIDDKVTQPITVGEIFDPDTEQTHDPATTSEIIHNLLNQKKIRMFSHTPQYKKHIFKPQELSVISGFSIYRYLYGSGVLNITLMITALHHIEEQIIKIMSTEETLNQTVDKILYRCSI